MWMWLDDQETQWTPCFSLECGVEMCAKRWYGGVDLQASRSIALRISKQSYRSTACLGRVVRTWFTGPRSLDPPATSP